MDRGDGGDDDGEDSDDTGDDDGGGLDRGEGGDDGDDSDYAGDDDGEDGDDSEVAGDDDGDDDGDDSPHCCNGKPCVSMVQQHRETRKSVREERATVSALSPSSVEIGRILYADPSSSTLR